MCARLRCHPLAECAKGASGSMECVCRRCPPVHSPVCGNNNLTYSSECELYRTVCESRSSDLSSLAVEYHGVCTARPCPKSECTAPHSVCGRSGGAELSSTDCHCPECDHTFDPVCGSDNVLYDNLCQMRRTACTSRTTIRTSPIQFCGKWI